MTNKWNRNKLLFLPPKSCSPGRRSRGLCQCVSLRGQKWHTWSCTGWCFVSGTLANFFHRFSRFYCARLKLIKTPHASKTLKLFVITAFYRLRTSSKSLKFTRTEKRPKIIVVMICITLGVFACTYSKNIRQCPCDFCPIENTYQTAHSTCHNVIFIRNFEFWANSKSFRITTLCPLLPKRSK